MSEFVPGIALIVAGLLIRYRRPKNRCWWLLVAVGFTWYVGDFEHSLHDNISLLGFAFGGWHDLFLAWAILASFRSAGFRCDIAKFSLAR